jgi:hypothetical protein
MRPRGNMRYTKNWKNMKSSMIQSIRKRTPRIALCSRKIAAIFTWLSINLFLLLQESEKDTMKITFEINEIERKQEIARQEEEMAYQTYLPRRRIGGETIEIF